MERINAMDLESGIQQQLVDLVDNLKLFDAQATGGHLLDTRGCIVEVNRAELDMLGLSKVDMIGKPVWEFLTPNERDKSKQSVMAKLAGVWPASVAIVRHYQAKSGRIVAVEVHDRILHDKKGNITGILTTLVEISPQKSLGLPLNQNDQIYLNLTHFLHVYVLRKDRHGTITFANQALTERLNQPLEGKTDLSLFPNHATEYHRGDMQVFMSGEPVESEEDHPFGNDLRRVHVIKAPVYNDEGEIIEVQVVFWEAAKLDAAYRELKAFSELLDSRRKEVREHFADSFEGAIEGRFHMSLEGNFLAVNKEMTSILGLTKEDLTKELGPVTHQDLYNSSALPAKTPDLKPPISASAKKAHTRLMQRLSRDGQVCNNVFNYHRPDGGRIWISETIWRSFDKVNKTPYYQGTLKDVTAERNAAAEKKQAEERYNILSGKYDTIVFQCDLFGNLLYLNGNGERVFGISSSHAIGQNLQKLMVPEEAEKVGTMLENTVNSKPIHFETIFATKGGGRLPVEIVALRYRTLRGDLRIEGLVWDVTKIRRLENEVQAAQQHKQAATLLASVAHDFNNILTVQSLTLARLQHLVANNPGVSDSVAYLMENTVAPAMALCKLLIEEHQNTPLQLVLHDLNQIVSDGIRLAKALAGTHVRIESKLDPLLWRAKLDYCRILHATINLIKNAAEAMPERRGRIEVSTRNFDASQLAELPKMTVGGLMRKPYVVLSIKDDGKGMSKSLIRQIFQAPCTTKDPGQGHGLASPRLKDTVSKHSGCIVVESALGKGTSFHIYLPAERGETLGESIPTVELHETGIAPVKDVSRPRILLVDDDSNLRSMVKMLLENDFDVIEAGRGSEAAKYFEKDKEIAATLLDVNLPDMDGLECLRQIRAQAPSAKVFIFSGMESTLIQAEMLEAGAAAVFKKPEDINLLTKELKAAVH